MTSSAIPFLPFAALVCCVLLAPVSQGAVFLDPRFGNNETTITVVKYPSQPALFGTPFKSDVRYPANLYLAPDDYLCSSPSSRLKEPQRKALQQNYREEVRTPAPQEIPPGLAIQREKLDSSTLLPSNTTRLPIALLVKRGKCVFTDKARHAMAFNDYFSTSSVKIEYLVVYNNDNGTENELVIMKDGSDPQKYTVGLVFIGVFSGIDVLNKMNATLHNSYVGGASVTNVLSSAAFHTGTTTVSYSSNNTSTSSSQWYFPILIDSSSPYDNADRFDTFPPNSKPSDGSHHGANSFFWMRFLLIFLLIFTPLTRGIYLFFTHGGRIHIARHPDSGGFRGFSVVWSSRADRNGGNRLGMFNNRGWDATIQEPGKLTEEQVFSLPEIEYGMYTDYDKGKDWNSGHGESDDGGGACCQGNENGSVENKTYSDDIGCGHGKQPVDEDCVAKLDTLADKSEANGEIKEIEFDAKAQGEYLSSSNRFESVDDLGTRNDMGDSDLRETKAFEQSDSRMEVYSSYEGGGTENNNAFDEPIITEDLDVAIGAKNETVLKISMEQNGDYRPMKVISAHPRKEGENTTDNANHLELVTTDEVGVNDDATIFGGEPEDESKFHSSITPAAVAPQSASVSNAGIEYAADGQSQATSHDCSPFTGLEADVSLAIQYEPAEALSVTATTAPVESSAQLLLSSISRDKSSDTLNQDKSSHALNEDSPSSTLSSEEKLEPTLQSIMAQCTVCSICIDDFVKGEKLRLLPRCGHLFHTDCILPWLTKRHGLCPLCKRGVIDDGPNDGIEIVVPSSDVETGTPAGPSATEAARVGNNDAEDNR